MSRVWYSAPPLRLPAPPPRVRPAYGDYRWRRRERARGLRAIHNGGADLTKGTAGARLVSGSYAWRKTVRYRPRPGVPGMGWRPAQGGADELRHPGARRLPLPAGRRA